MLKKLVIKSDFQNVRFVKWGQRFRIELTVILLRKFGIGNMGLEFGNRVLEVLGPLVF